MFREFVADDLTQLCTLLPHTLYHLDGKGELPHLPQIAAIRQLDAIQWCPGDGAPRTMEWPEVYRQIRQAGKNIHVLGARKDFDSIAKDIGAKGLYLNLSAPASAKDEYVSFLNKYLP